ncbi:pyruvate dehydrogenase kinase-like protein [Protomyces lactucae-debilis]|uniref:Protein-serine/threonine kinase n=1 Tax=Protomyces lactucae-debilis TaxID=2754530 RepID=A0A1Y2FC62_PROLT|nr:pyruvate dehydrogenase kinase-like protein [Protomyces lactucae-debilis]ORY80916.1 pyruvate dehydrogenase kinase-like protein [Protomyces lactucae-debilis]
MAWKYTPQLASQIKHFASFPQTGISLHQMVQFGSNSSQGTLFRASQFIHEELPIRLAHRVKELAELPDNLNEMPSINKVKEWYAQSFEDLTTMERPTLTPELRSMLKGNGNGSASLPSTTRNLTTEQYSSNRNQNNGMRRSVPVQARYYGKVEDVSWPPEITSFNDRLAKSLNVIKRRHDSVVTTMAQGILEYKKAKQRSSINKDIQAFLDRFYMSRIGIRMLIGQHIALLTEPPREDYVGVICTKTSVPNILQEAIDNARFICEDYYGLYDAPKVQLICPSHLNFMYVPGHLAHVAFEVLKNSLRAVVETHGVDKENFPPVKVIVVEGAEDITIKISDEGGGIPRSAMPLVWTYMYTTAESQDLDPDFNKSDFKAPMAGFGYGLPISRLYARYFGGDLKLESLDGYGTDCYINLNRLSSSEEPLP